MATLVCFHAHPDDECIATGGVMAKAAKDGHRVVLVVATRGEHGEVDERVLDDDGEELWQRRVKETEASADILGAQRVEFLGYVDSGMIGTPENDKSGSFWTADVDEAAERLANILREENADVLTIYDDHGGYGHPDHIQVHRVGKRGRARGNAEGVPGDDQPRPHHPGHARARVDDAGGHGDARLRGRARLRLARVGHHLARSTCRSSSTTSAARCRPTPARSASSRSSCRCRPKAFAYGFGTEWFIRDGQGPGITETSIL